MRASSRSVIVLIVAVLWVRTAAGQGLYWESTTAVADETPRTAQAYAVPTMMKVVGDDGHTLILRGDQEKLITLDTSRRTYSEFTFAELEASAKAAQTKLDEQLQHLPPERRADIEKLVQKRGGVSIGQAPTVDVKNAGETKQINGYACKKYVATSSGQTVLVAWTTNDLKGFDKLKEDWRSYQKRFASLNGTMSAAAVARTQLDGFPMETEAGPVKTRVTKVESRAIPASEFDVPAGYTKETVKLPGAG